MSVVWYILVLCVVAAAIAYVVYNYQRIRKMPEGTAEMAEMAGIIRSGANTFMKTEYRTIIIVVILLSIIIIHIVRIGLKSGRLYDMLICMGVAAAMTFQTLINIGMCIGITPVIGITLPFFSYGGSSMVTMYIAMGLVSGIKYKLKPEHFSLIY